MVTIKEVKEYEKKSWIIVLMLIILIMLFMFYPRPLSKFMGEGEINILMISSKFENNESKTETNFYIIKENMPEYKQIQDIIQKYNYHYSFWSIYPGVVGVVVEEEGYQYFQIESNGNTLVISDAQEIEVKNDNVHENYLVGYFDNLKTKQLNREIEEICSKLEPEK